jgi:soluble lytic murein transglycosylase-like protein
MPEPQEAARSKASTQCRIGAAMTASRLVAISVALAFMSSAPGAVAETNACEREMARAAQKHGVPLGMLYAVGLTETGRGDSLRPYALNVDGRAVYDIDREGALRHFHAAQRAGAKLIDVGCMQVNHHFHGRHFASVEEMLDPAKNVDYAARFLVELKAREGSWTKAVARYHAGPNNDPAQKKYVCRVIANMVATGFGAWTPEANAFCRP